jgi:hypothetical protein
MIKALLPLALILPFILVGKLIFARLLRVKAKSRKRGNGSFAAPERVRPARRRKPFPLHPFLISFFPALSLVSENANLLSVDRKVGAIALITLLIDSILFFIFKLMTKSNQRAAALISPSLLLFASYGHVYDLLNSRFGAANIRHRHIVPVWGFLELIVVWTALRARRTLDLYTNFLNAISASLVGITLAQIILGRSKRPAPRVRPNFLAKTSLIDSESGPLRDIYYLVVDAHAGNRALAKIYGFDNRTFTDSLAERGFFIAGRSQSNYAMTTLSLGSALNLEYLDPSLGRSGSSEEGLVWVNRLVEENFATQFLKARGYQSIFLGSGYGVTRKNRLADIDIKCGRIDETVGRFIQSTFLRILADRNHLLENDKRERILRMFNQLSQLPRLAGPKFIFAHIASPQTPFLFDADGHDVQPAEIPLDLEKEAYIEQMTFIDRRLTALVDELLELSEIDPVIIIQADHGPNFAYPGRYRLQPPLPDVVFEKMQILNAYHLPGIRNGLLYESISPVNTFRLVFNEYFNTGLPLLDDRHYYSTLGDPFRLYLLPSLA